MSNQQYQQFPGQNNAHRCAPGAQYPGAPVGQYPGASAQPYPGASKQAYPVSGYTQPYNAPQPSGQASQNSGTSVGYIPGTTQNKPTAFYSQGWGNRGYPGQIYPQGSNPNAQFPGQQKGQSYANYYFVFNPKQYTDTYNPWTAKYWSDPSSSEMQSKQQQQAPQPQKPQQPQQQPQPQKPQQQQPKPQPTTPPSQPKPQPVQPQQPQNTKLQEPAKSIFQFESIQQFQELRQHTTVESAISQLTELGQDLSKVDVKDFHPKPNSCFLICNSYTKPQYKLGVGPINDAITCGANLAYLGYHIYFLHDPHHNTFLAFFQKFLSETSGNLVLYYTGHGAQIKDRSGDEDDGYDEVMIFDSGYIIDDTIADYIVKYLKNDTRVVLLADCCHSGTIWDIPESLDLAKSRGFPKNVMSISSAADTQTAKQTQFNKMNQGVFTYNFWTIVRNNPKVTATEIKRILDPELTRFNQMLVYNITSDGIQNEPIFRSFRK